MSYTKEEKNVIYKKALEILISEKDNKQYHGLCFCIDRAINGDTITSHIYDTLLLPLEETEFPEIVDHRPEEHTSWWWDDTSDTFDSWYEPRIKVLKQAIEETEPSEPLP
jgi:hypothetical protein